MSKTESTKALTEAMAEIDAAREAARLKLHLLSLDARSTWNDLEGKCRTFKETLERQSEHAIDSSASTARDLARSLRRFVESHL